MSTTVKGLILIIVVGLVILAVAALADRRTRLRGEGRLPAGPDDDSSTQPEYRTMTELLRGASSPSTLDPKLESGLRDATSLSLKLASPSLATHDQGRCLAADTRVLVCDDPVTTVRELLPIWASLPPQQAMTIAAPSFDAAVIDVFVANLAAGTRLVQAVTGDADAVNQLAGLTNAISQPRYELQAGGVPPTALGHASLIVASGAGTLVKP